MPEFKDLKPKEKFDWVANAAAQAGDPHPLVTAAQWALESGWGKHQSGKNNFFGIKSAKKGEGSLVPTWEVYNGKKVNIKDWFADYATVDEGIAARVKFAQGSRYRDSYSRAKTPYEAAEALRRAGYATDPDYAKKLSSIMKGVGYDPNKPWTPPKKNTSTPASSGSWTSPIKTISQRSYELYDKFLLQGGVER